MIEPLPVKLTRAELHIVREAANSFAAEHPELVLSLRCKELGVAFGAFLASIALVATSTAHPNNAGAAEVDQ